VFKKAITVATVIGNLCLSRCRKADSISFRSCIRTLASITHFVAQKPDRTNAIRSVLNVFRTEAELQNAVTTKPYVERGRMSNQQKAEFIGDIFHMRSCWGGHGEISPKNLFHTGRYDLPEKLFQRPVEFPTAVTHKSLTGWSRLMDHRKAGSSRSKQYLGLPEFQPIQDRKMKIRFAADLSWSRIQQRRRSSNFHIS
jgi:hypothetical protein